MAKPVETGSMSGKVNECPTANQPSNDRPTSPAGKAAEAACFGLAFAAFPEGHEEDREFRHGQAWYGRVNRLRRQRLLPCDTSDVQFSLARTVELAEVDSLPCAKHQTPVLDQDRL